MFTNKETLVNSSIFDSNCGKMIISWKLHCQEDEKLTIEGLYDVFVSSSPDEIKQHVSNHFLEDCKVQTSSEKVYSVDGFPKSVLIVGFV